MTSNDGRFDLSRRKLLGTVGTIGGASALGATGTMAFFSDEEEFANNQLTAGSLDLKVDWEEHYSDWSDDEAEGLQNPVLMPGDDIPDNYVGLPFCATNKLVYVAQGDLATFMDNTSIEAMPDTNNDGIQDDLAGFDICTLPWDTPGILDPAGPRTDDDATEDITLLEDGTPAPLIYLQDLKPGDFGELTLSFHLCDNDGYVWLNGALTENAENGLTEPESQDPDENGGEPGELADAIQACVWYDENCDNQLDGEVEPAPFCLDVVLDMSGSMEEDLYADGDPSLVKHEAARTLTSDIIAALDGDGNGMLDNGVASIDYFRNGEGFNAGGPSGTPLTATDSVDALNDALADLDGDGTDDNTNFPQGSTNIPAAFDLAGTTIENCPPDHQPYVVFITNGGPSDSEARQAAIEAAGDLKEAGATVKVVGFDVDDDDTSAVDFLTQLASSEGDLFLVQQDAQNQPRSGDADTVDAELDAAQSGVVSQLEAVEQTGEEEVIFNGSLVDLLDRLNQGRGLPLDGDRSTPFDELTGDPADDARECFEGSTTQCIGIEWWLDADDANEIQTDSIMFDLGFYTEQCRHNSGAGMGNQGGNNA